jgi:hypothetical protein
MPDIGHKRGDHVIDLALIKKPRLWAMTISMLDQMMFNLSCGHEVVLGRMANMESWACEACGNTTDLTAEPFKSRLAHDLDTAMQIDSRSCRGATPSPGWLSHPVTQKRDDLANALTCRLCHTQNFRKGA